MAENKDFFVRVTLSPEQTRTVLTALDFYSRVMCGQFEEINRAFYSSYRGDRDHQEALLRELREQLMPNLDDRASGYGIAECPNRTARISYDILQVVRQVLAKAEEPNGNRMLVNYSDPMFVSDSEPRPKASTINVLDRMVED